MRVNMRVNHEGEFQSLKGIPPALPFYYHRN